jgi:hypothetical protein
MPATCYVPLVALLHRRVSDDEITTITSELMTRRRESIGNADVGVEITRVTDEMPSPQDIERIHAALTRWGTRRQTGKPGCSRL